MSGANGSRDVRVAIVGAGFGGVAMALALKKAGQLDDRVTIIDAAEEFGGTWRDNVYPGCACDVPSPLYSLRDEPHAWPSFYSSQPAIQDYILKVVAKHGLRDHARLGVAVTRQVWDADRARWVLTFADGATLEAEVVINCLGLLRVPLIPELLGRDRFAGPAFHSARWDTGVDVAGKRVGVIGTGASAVQIIPSIAEETARVEVFQRTASWVLPRLERDFSAVERLALKVPGTHGALRAWVDWMTEHQVYPALAMDEGAQQRIRKLGEWNIRHGIEDPALREAVTPTITPGCKRLMFSNTYYPALAREDVGLHTGAIEEITPSGVRLRDGEHVDLDVLVWATGFDPHHFWHPIDIVGQDGVRIDEQWKGGASAYLCTTAPRFPNMFFLHGPNTGTGHTSVLLMLEAQADYAVQALRYLRTGAVDWFAPTQESLDGFTAELIERHADLVWATGCDAWYTNADGVNDTIFPGTAKEFERRLARFDIERYATGRVPAPTPA